MVHVAKYFFWNIIASILLITLGSDYVTRFWITYIIVIILAVTLLMKVITGIIYLLKYFCCDSISDPRDETYKGRAESTV